MSGHHEHIPVPEGYPVQQIDERVHLKFAPIWISLIGLTTLIIVSMSLVRAFQLALSKDVPVVRSNSVRSDFAQAPGTAPLSSAQVPIRKEYEKSQAAILNSYGWNDAEKSSAHIPINAAMQKIVSQYGDKK